MAEAPKSCSYCNAHLEPGATKCRECGKQVARANLPAGKAAWIAATALVILCIGGGLWVFREVGARKQSSAKLVNSASETNPAALPDGTTISYARSEDGDRLVLTVVSASDPVLFFDNNADGAIDRGDAGYAVDSWGAPCVFRLKRALEHPVCGSAPSGARIKITSLDQTVEPGGRGRRSFLWSIPLAELGFSDRQASFSVGLFDEARQTFAYYPARPFERVYHLQIHSSPNAQSTPPLPPSPMPSVARSPATVKTTIPAPSVEYLEANPATLQSAGNVQLRWSVKNAGDVVIQPDIGQRAPQDELTVSVNKSTSWTLTASGPGGTVVRTIAVTVAPPPPPHVDSFQVQPATVRQGESAKLRWSVSGTTTSVRIEPGFAALPASGERDVQVSATTTFALTAEGPGGSTSAQLTIQATPAAPVIALDASPNNLHPGDPTTLHWNVSGANTINLSPGVGAVAAVGSIVLRPIRTIRYSMIAQGPGGSSERDETIIVVRPSGPSSGQIVWTGEIHGYQLVTISRDRADVGQLQGALPGLPCIVQPTDEKDVSIASSPGPRNDYSRLILRVKGHGHMKVVLNWSLQ